MTKIASAPLVSTLMCTYNAEQFFDATIRSVLDQTYQNQEILIRDDGSSDGTLELLNIRSKKDDRVRIFVDPGVKRGPYGGLNFLLDNAKGDYIAIQDHDDIRHPEKLEKQVVFLEENSEYTGCGVQLLYYFQSYHKVIKHIETTGAKERCGHTGLMYRMTDARYDTDITVGTDSYFMLRGLEGKLYLIDFVGTLHRRRSDGNNLSKLWSHDWKGRRQMCRNGVLSLKTTLYHFYSSVFPWYERWSINVFSKARFVDLHRKEQMRLILGNSYAGWKSILKSIC